MTEIERQSLYFGGCFGWLHIPRPLHAGTRGVILCAPLGDEALGTYRAWRGLADGLAGVGMPVLRFEYPATGDSLLAEGELHGLQPYLDSIHQAAQHLREHLGVTQIAVCGLRVGATLAAMASATIGATKLAVLAPLVTGRSYLRELRASARMLAAIWQVPAAIEQDGWFEAMGVRLDAQTRQEMEAVDLFQVDAPPAEAALVVGSAAACDVLTKLAGFWRDRGCAATVEIVDDLDAYLQDSSTSVMPRATFDRVVSWLAEGAPVADSKAVVSSEEVATPACVGAACEVPVRFGQGGYGFGIWCRPRSSKNRNAPVLLILNTTLNPRAGNSRMAVTLARSLASQGVSSLRIDNAGSGDSASETDEYGHPYASENVSAVQAALDWVAERDPGSIVLFGLCSGAYSAFHVAVKDARVRALILVNMQKLIWSAGMSIKVIQQGTLRSSYYLERLGEGGAWKRLVRGDVAVRRIGGELMRRTAAGLANTMQARLGYRVFGGKSSKLVWRWFDDLNRRQVKIVMLLGSHDPARDEIEIYFGAEGKRLRAYPTVELKILDGIDHSLSTIAMREQVINQVAATLAAQEPA